MSLSLISSTRLVMLTSLVATQVLAGEFATMLKQCRIEDKVELNQCLIRIMDDLKPKLSEGIPEINLPVLEPMLMQNIQFKQGQGVVSITADFMDVHIAGLSNFTTTHVNADPVARELHVGLTVPDLRVTGVYDLKGNVFILPITGHGTFWTIFENIVVYGVSRLEVSQVGGEERLTVTETRVNFDIGKLRLRLNNLFNGDRILGETVNLFLNDNGHEILKEVKPEVARQLNGLVQKVMNDAFSQLPVDTFILPKQS